MGRQLINYAKNATPNFQKSLAYAHHVWYPNSMEPKISGKKLYDLILYVRKKMYKEKKKKKKSFPVESNESLLHRLNNLYLDPKLHIYMNAWYGIQNLFLNNFLNILILGSPEQ